MPTNNPSPSKPRQIAGNLLIYLTGLVLLFGGLTKFAHVPKVVSQMNSMGLGGDKLLLVASLELLAALLLVIRPARSFGLLFLSSFLGGAICAHLQSNQYFAVLPPMIVLGSSWLGTLLRHPQALWSLKRDHSASHPAKQRDWVATQA